MPGRLLPGTHVGLRKPPVTTVREVIRMHPQLIECAHGLTLQRRAIGCARAGVVDPVVASKILIGWKQ
jgi:hypothetical protein